MEKYILIVKDAAGDMISCGDLIADAGTNIVQAAASCAHVLGRPECCEVWYKDTPHSARLLVTVF